MRTTGLEDFLSREGRDLGVAFQAPPGSQASSRGEAKDSALLSSRDAGLMNIFIFFIQTLEQIVNYLAVFDSWKVQLFVSLFTPEAAFPGNRLYTASSCQPPGLKQTQGQICCFYKSLQSCPTLCDPIDGSPPGSPDPGILQARLAQMVKASVYNVGDLGSIPGSGRTPGEGNGNPLQCSCLENPRVGGAWWASVYGVAHSRT